MKKVEKAIPGPCFHGECYIICPHCGKGTECYCIKETEDNIHECHYCKGKYYYSRFEG